MPGTLNVSNLTELYSALAKAQGGETILLAGGNYGDFTLNMQTKFNFTFPSNVTIASADLRNPAIFSGVDVVGAANLTFDGVTFDYTFSPGDQISDRPFQFSNSQNIAIRNSTFDGDVAKGVSPEADGLGFCTGLAMRQCSGSTVENNEFFSFYRGLTMGQGFDATIRGNELHSMRMDGMNFAQMQGIVIEDNYIHDFVRSSLVTDHADMIQFWTNGTTKPSTDIIIRNNVLDIGDGDNTQSIFMRNDLVDRGLAGSEMFYQNVLIENNEIYNGHKHGVVVGATSGLVICNNSVLHADGSAVDGVDNPVEIPCISASSNSTNVLIANNIVSAISGWSGQKGWTVNSNAFVQDQDPNAPGYYGDVFIDFSLQSAHGPHNFIATPGGMIARLGAGSSDILYNPVSSGPLDAQFMVSEDPVNSAARIFDARVTAFDIGTRPVGTAFIWDFGDGTMARGSLVSHTFSTGGNYDVTLKVVLPDGTIDSASYQVGIAGSEVVSMDPSGQFHVYDNGVELLLGPVAAASAAGLQLGAKGVTASIAGQHLTPLVGTDTFKIGMTLQADTANSFGEVFRMKDFFIATISPKGELEFRIFPSGGTSATLTTKGAALNDQAQHDVEVRFDKGHLQIYVDQMLMAETTTSGQMRTSGESTLMFGNAWGGWNFKGDMTSFEITVNESSYQSASKLSTLVDDPTLQDSDPLLDTLDLDTDTTNIFSDATAPVLAKTAGSLSDHLRLFAQDAATSDPAQAETAESADVQGSFHETIREAAVQEAKSAAQSTHTVEKVANAQGAHVFASSFFGATGSQLTVRPAAEAEPEQQVDHASAHLGDRFEFFSGPFFGHDMMAI